jgi:PadR family transcriptional regulator, regulatory protein PadR
MSKSATHDAIPQGTLDMLILRTLETSGRQHGFEIARSIQAHSGNVLMVEEGSLYPALQRLLVQGWIEGEWSTTEDNRRARYYRITRAGQKRLADEMERYRRVSTAIARILQPA